MSHRLLSPLLASDALTRGLGDPEARILVEWLVDQADLLAQRGAGETTEAEMGRLGRRARALGRFVRLWCHDQDAAAAYQLAASERFPWPLPTQVMDPCDLMEEITAWEHPVARSQPL
jgi:hypothetical protein